MITKIKQSDERWKYCRIGNSSATMKRYGCYVSSLCMALEKLRGWYCNPRDACAYWNFNLKGEFLSSTKFKGMKLVKKANYYDRRKVEEYANAKDKAVVLQLNNGKHFIYVDKVEGTKMTYIDPIDGLSHDDMSLHYKITGMRLLESDQMEVPEWAKSAVEKAKKKGLDVGDLFNEVDTKVMQEFLKDLSVIKEVGKMPVYRFLKVLDKIKLL